MPDSLVWRHFRKPDGEKSVVVCCTVKGCGAKIARGGQNAQKFGTGGLRQHLRCKHKALFEEIEKEEKEAEDKKREGQKRKAEIYSLADAKPPKQLKLDEMFAKSTPYKNGDQAQKSHEYRTGEWLCLATLPYTAVENEAYKRMMHDANPQLNLRSEKHYRTTIVPDIHSRLKAKIISIISDKDDVKYICLTTDFWTSESRIQYMALTLHYINKWWKRKMAVIDCRPACESHTAEQIAEWFTEVFDEWDLHNRCHLVLRDNAANLVSALRMNEIKSFGCFLHTLNLVVHHSIFGGENQQLKPLLERAQKLTLYFRRQKAEQQLHRAQTDTSTPHHTLLLAEPTRWNTYQMQLERQFEQKDAVQLATIRLNSDRDMTKKPPAIPDSDWSMIENALKLLNIIAVVSVNAEKEDVSMSEVIPSVTKLRARINSVQFTSSHTACNKIKKEILRQIENYFGGKDPLGREHFVDVLHSGDCALATILDPRFKTNFHQSETNTELESWSRGCLVQALDKLCNEETSRSPDRSNEPSTSSHSPQADGGFYSDVLPPPRKTYSNEDTQKVKNEKIVTAYLSEPRITSDPLEYWKHKESDRKWKKLAKLARKYLSAPLSSVASERTFKTAKQISEGDRSSLLAEHVQELLFCKYNLRAVNFEY